MIAQNRVPSEFECPITSEIMEDPVICADGRSYERVAILKWLQTSNKSPMTGESLPHTNVIPNVNLKALIQDWRETEVVHAVIREEQTALQELPRNELARLRKDLERAFRQEEGLTLVVERAMRVYNDRLQDRFDKQCALLRTQRGECPVVTRYHGTNLEAAASIVREGFRLPTPDTTGSFVSTGLRVYYTNMQREAMQEHAGDELMFGQAIYVSTDLEKATRFAQGALILCQCALGKFKKVRAAELNLTQASLRKQGYDSVQALSGCEQMGGCRFEEHALYHQDQVMPTHVVHFKLVKTGVGTLVAQHISENLVKVKDLPLDSILNDLGAKDGRSDAQIHSCRIRACKKLGDVARDDQEAATAAFLSNRKLVALLTGCARSSNEALQFEALRAWWNFSYNDMRNQALALQQLGVYLLVSLLDSPNRSIRLRSVGLIWNLTQHADTCRKVLAEAGVIAKIVNLLSENMSRLASHPWGALQLLLGALANLAMTFSSELKTEAVMHAGQQLASFGPEAVQQQAIRLLCNLISDGVVDYEWQINGYANKTSAPRDSAALVVVES
eukprot:gnl/MRDRNA2_/MRDRNA2_95617_c0_seq1.p1 gnl/MRDRNA2_/MRDRNA2_95617_c0~~gnl/MRDRNA2_/MRDRNA2_95617_c0_seq1.p1  ORF type:complete len:561 (+),score=108.39 gnl/MRDRNA2_/MRDRNA2_95617_c0_seq1:72-1754(+)